MLDYLLAVLRLTGEGAHHMGAGGVDRSEMVLHLSNRDAPICEHPSKRDLRIRMGEWRALCNSPFSRCWGFWEECSRGWLG